MDFGQAMVGIADAMASALATDEAKAVQSPPAPPTFNLTQRVLMHMMRENTGASILDSGGAYGRAWQRNLKADFSKRDRCTLQGDVYTDAKGRTSLSLDVTIDLFSYLANRLDYDRALTRQYRKFAAERKDTGHLEDMGDFPAWIAEKRGVDGEVEYTGNSYNEDNFLSGTVQYTCFELDGEHYVLLQIHGGCDVRGGYTAPQVFQLDQSDGQFGDWYSAQIFPKWGEVQAMKEALQADLDRQAFLFPPVAAEYSAEVAAFGEDVHWSVGSWDDKGEGCRKNLEDYPCKAIETRDQWVRGTVCTLPDRTVLCPETGATLDADFWN